MKKRTVCCFLDIRKAYYTVFRRAVGENAREGDSGENVESREKFVQGGR